MKAQPPSALDRRKFVVIGVGIALAELHRLHGCEVEVADVAGGLGLDLAAFTAAGVARYDLDVLKEILP